MNLQKLADQLLPFLLPLLRSSAAQSGSGGGPLAQHQLSGSLHVGTLADEQAPQFLKTDGSRELTGNLNVAPGVMIDGVDISAHAGDPAAHHAPATAGNGLSISGQQLSLTTPGTLSATSANNAAGNHTHAILTAAAVTLGGNTSNTAGSSASLARADHTHAISTGVPVALSVGTTNAPGTSHGLARADHTHDIITSSNPGAAAAILASDASGSLTLVSLTATSKLRSPLLDTASGALTLAPASDLILNPGSGIVRMGSGDAIQSDGYASQTTGWRISGAGEADFRYLFVDEMHAKSFIADLEQALAGGQIISKSVAVLASPFAVPSPGGAKTIRVHDLPSAPGMPVFQDGDIVCLRKFLRTGGSLTIADCWGTVSNYEDKTANTQTWTFTRSTSPNAGSMAAGTVVDPDSLVLDYGVSGNGFYEVNAIDGTYGLNSPYAQVVSWTTHPATGQTVRARLGNLSGVFGTNNEYGLFAGNGTSINDPHLRISNTGIGLYNLPLRMFTGGTERVHIASHNDVWIGPSPSDKRLIWNGSTLTVTGTINVLGGNAAKTDLSNSVISTLISGSSIRVGSGTKDVNLNGWNIDSTEIVGQKNGEDQVVMNTSGQIVAGAGTVALNRYGYIINQGNTSVGGAWPIPAGGLHAIENINNPANGYLGSLIFGRANGVWGDLGVTWYFRYPGTLPLTPWGNNNDGVSWQNALVICDDNESHIVWHSNNDGPGSGLNADKLDNYHASDFALLSGASFSGNVSPAVSNAKDLGTQTLKWRTLYVGTVEANTVTANFLGSWTSLSLASPWTNWGSGWATAAYCTFGDWVLIRGLVKTTTNVAANSTIATLPTVARPAQNRRFFTSNSVTSSNANMAELDIFSSGEIMIQKPVAANFPVSIECMFKK